MNIGVHISFLIGVSGFLGYSLRSGITGSNGSSIFNFLMKFYAVLHSSCKIMHSHQQCKRLPFPLHSHQHFLFVHLMIAILTGVRWYLIVILSFISWIISDFEHVCLCLLAFCMSSLESVYLGSLPSILLDCLSFFCCC